MTGSAPKQSDKGKYYDFYFITRGIFNSIKDNEYSEFLHNSDQVLRNIGLNLVENYDAQYKVCKMSNDSKECCNYLNKWLNEKRALYTSNQACKSHKDLWEHYIEGLWKKMQAELEEEDQCKRDNTGPKHFQDKWIIPSCNIITPIKVEKSCPNVPAPVPETRKQECPSQAAPTYSSCKAALTTTYFSSVGIKINNLIRGKKINKRNTDEENNDSFRSDDNFNMESLGNRFNVIYNSFQN
ncbi:PIR Superfamily Protein [Plasmodium ovale curtisi]|uniref:PIR Superfamily Protein n=1 Tax=Plasmodium ovale curtisi TaxID=864141 RepID=A0A1A8XAR5_PLAOA|nr:PIR Superfamily Protein [Plasmodium ovale curtisi]